MPTNRYGAYGFVLRGMEGAQEWLNPAPEDWPEVSVGQILGRPKVNTNIGESQAAVALTDDRAVFLEREPLNVRFEGPTELSEEALVHPYLAPAASVLARWHGWNALHAGGFETDGRAWIVTAARRGGKSTTLSAMAAAGYPIVSDDVIVMKRDVAVSGPRSLDLREPPQSEEANFLGIVGDRRRWRMPLLPASAELPVAGVIKLNWSVDPRVERVSTDQRMEVLVSSLSIRSTPTSFLRLLSLPSFEVFRPRGPLEETVSLIEEAVTQAN